MPPSRLQRTSARLDLEGASEILRRAMTPALREELRQKLEDLDRELRTRSPAKVEPNRTSPEDIGGDEDDQPLNEMLQSVASGRNRNDAQVAALVTRALAKLRDEPEDFGVCEDCNEDILVGRMKALPYARFCVACQSLHDGSKGRPTRSKLTDYR